MGLPAELRLHIYSHLHATALVHVHYHEATETSERRFTWTPCRGTLSSNRLLCANPKWSGSCAEEERCTYNKLTPSEPRGFFALAASCKALCNEIGDLFYRCGGVSIKQDVFERWLEYMTQRAPRYLEQLRRITFEGHISSFSFLFYQPGSRAAFRRSVPRLEAIAVQTQEPLRSLVRESRGADIWVRNDVWKMGVTSYWLRDWDADIDITVELMACWNPKRIHIGMWNPDVVEQQIVMRIMRPPIEGGGVVAANGQLEWSDEDVRVEVVKPGCLMEPKRNAKWRAWWQDKRLW
jgi:hypothetical protein